MVSRKERKDKSLRGDAENFNNLELNNLELFNLETGIEYFKLKFRVLIKKILCESLCPSGFVAEDYLPLRLEDTKGSRRETEKLFIIIGSRQERKERPRSKHAKNNNLDLKIKIPSG